MITDIHCHYVPSDFLQLVRSRDEFGIKITRTEREAVDVDFHGAHVRLEATFFDMEKQAARLERDGLQRAILSLATPFIDYHLDASLALDAAQTFNDGLASAIAVDRASFGGWGMLPMQDPEAAARELRRCVRELGFIGGHVASNVQGVYLDDRCFDSVFHAAVNLGVPLFVHPADPLGKERMRDYELTVVAGYLFDSTVNILKLICSGALDRWPTLKLVFAHAGAFSSMLRARLQSEADTNPELGSRLTMPVGDYLGRLYYDTICFDPAILRYVAGVVPPSHLLLGTDAPFPLSQSDPVNFVREALPAADAEMVLSQSFDQLLRG